MIKFIAVLAVAVSLSACTTPVNKVCEVVTAKVFDGEADLSTTTTLPTAKVAVVNDHQFTMVSDSKAIESPIMYLNSGGNYVKQYDGVLYGAIDGKYYTVKTKTDVTTAYNCKVVNDAEK